MAGDGKVAQEWQQKIIDTGEKWKKDSAEETAIAFIERHRKAGMPPERLRKLIDEITKILEHKVHDKVAILKECEIAWRRLWGDIKKSAEAEEQADIMEARASCIRNKFDARYINGEKTAKYLNFLASNPEEIKKLHGELIKDPELLAGFLRYWSLQRVQGWDGTVRERSNIFQILWKEHATIKFMEKYYFTFISYYKIEIKPWEDIRSIESKIQKAKPWKDSIMSEIFWKEIGAVVKKVENVVDKAVSIDSEIEESRKLPDWKKHKILEYSWRNIATTIETFEWGLKNLKIEQINSRGFAEYLKYLAKYKNWRFLSYDYLDKLMWSEKLWDLAILWGIGKDGENGDKSATLAKAILTKEGWKAIVDFFSLILQNSIKEKDKKITNLKNLDVFPKTENYLKWKWLPVLPEGFWKVIKSWSLSDIIIWLRDKTNVQIKTQQDAKDLFIALSDDSKQQLNVIKSAQKDTNIDEKYTVKTMAMICSFPTAALPGVLLTKQLYCLSKEELIKLQKMAEVSKKPESDNLKKWANLQIKKKLKQKMNIEASAAVESGQIQKASVDLSDKKTSVEKFEKVMRAWVSIYTQKEETKAEIQSDRELLASCLSGTGYSLEWLLSNSSQRKEFLSVLRAKKSLTDTEKKLKKILERIEMNERRSSAFESGGVEKLQKFDKENPEKSLSIGPEKTNTDTNHPRTRSTEIPFRDIDMGKPHTISLNRWSENSDKLTIERNGDFYTIRLANNPENTTELPRDKISAYIKSLRFLEKLGLGYFIRNLPQNELSNILELTSRGTTIVNNRDGNFDETEKKRIISSFGDILGIEGTDRIMNSHDGVRLFQKFFFTHSSIESILASRENKIIQNGSLNARVLKTTLKPKFT